MSARSTLSHALALARELTIGALAVIGCVVVQCVLLMWFALSRAMIYFVLLQARMLKDIYRQPVETHASRGTQTVALSPPSPIKAAVKPAIKAEPKLTAASPPFLPTPPQQNNNLTSTLAQSFLEGQFKGTRYPHAASYTPAYAQGYAPAYGPIYPPMPPPPARRSHAVAIRKPTAQTLITEPEKRTSKNATQKPTESTARQEPASATSGSARPKLAKRPVVTIARQSEASISKEPSGFKDVSNTHRAAGNMPPQQDIKPAPLHELRNRFIETSVLRKALDASRQQTVAAVKPSTQLRLSPKTTAREALKIAYGEREATRASMNGGYTVDTALEFAEKAQCYLEKRAELAAQMSDSQLDEDDDEAFPYLSVNDAARPEEVNVTHDEPGHFSKDSSTPALSNGSVSPEPLEDINPLVAKVNKAHQIMMAATKNMEHACMACDNKFCLNSYAPKAKPKMKTAKDLYEKSRVRLASAYPDSNIPSALSKQFPSIGGC